MSLVRHRSNPFLDQLVITKKKKQITVSPMGKDDNVLVNRNTGEISGTHVVTYKQVDDAEFIKLFGANVGLTFDLTSAGIKAFNVLIWSVQYMGMGKDEVPLDSLTLEDYLISNKDKKLSMATFKRGITDLVKANIIARTFRKGTFFINPNFAFNGDRIAFTVAIERKGNSSKNQVPDNQQSLL